MSRFFEYVRSKQPDALDWPYNAKSLSPAHSADHIEEVQKITEEWRRQRQAYPGWLILPHGNREKLWAFTVAWVNCLPGTDASPPGLDIQYAFELIWRLERCLLPVFNNISVFCEKLLEKYWPFQDINSYSNCRIHNKDQKFQDLPWNDIRQAWLAIAVWMLRFYREEGYLDKWKEAENRLKTLFDHLSAEQREFLNYEGFLFSLFTLELPNAKQRLENWRPNEAQPYWMAKRAAGLAEIGLLSEAEIISRNALENVRKKLNQKLDAADLTLVSLESYAMLLGKYIQAAAALGKSEWGTLRDSNAQFNDRRNELKGFWCDPWNEIKLFELTLRSPPVKKETVNEERLFDIGRITQTRHFRSTDEEGLSAYAFLRFCEEVGLPYRIGSYNMVAQIALESLQRISKYSSFWAIATLARAGDANAVNRLFSRESVYKFTAQEADQLIQNYLNALDKCRDDIHTSDTFLSDSYGVRLAQLLPEVLSRLCCKCSGETKHRVLEFVSGIYGSPDKKKYRNVKNLIKRLISSMTEVAKYNLIPDLLEIPFPEDLNLRINDDFPNPLLLLELNQKPECATDLNIQTELVNDLFRQAAMDDSDRRRWAIASLITLHKLQLIDDGQSKNLASAIWRITDQYGLPDSIDFYKFVFLRFPHPEAVDPARLFKNYVMSSFFPIQENEQDEGAIIMGENIHIVHEIIRANCNGGSIWTADDAAEILQRLLKWWDADKYRLGEKENFHENFPSIQEEFKRRFIHMLELLAEVVGPKLSADSSNEIKTSLGRLLNEVQDFGLPGLAAEAACLHIYPDQRANIYSRIKEALISNQKKMQKDGLGAISKIIFDGNYAPANPVEDDPASMLIQYLTWCPIDSISTALFIIVSILNKSPSSFSDSLKSATNKRLNRLFDDTAYGSDNTGLSFDEKLEVRRTSSILASSLWSYFKSRNLSIEGVVENWRAACLSPDEFSEIRNPWEHTEGFCA